MKASPAAWLIAFFAIAIPLSLRSQAPLEHAPSLPTNMGTSGPRTGLGSTSKDTTDASASATPDPEANTAEEDDSLYRGKTSESENPMLREEGRLHFKTHPKERIKEVDSKSLQSSGTDPKFQGSFIMSGTSSIDRVAEKGLLPADAATPAAEDKSQSDSPQFKRHMTFPAPEEEKNAKAGANSSPSPAASPSASPAKKKSSDAPQ